MLSLAEALAALPTTADGIAAHLHAKGIRGRKGSACGCPLAAYLLSLGLTDPVVTGGGISVEAEFGRKRCLTRPAAREFMTRFDRGEFPELVLDDTAEATDA